MKHLEEDPFTGSQGDKEKLVLRGGVVIYRLHISQSYTVFYGINKEEKQVIVQEILPIEQVHKKYGYY
jgi:mRNA-degrading endonuclease RelE of RelBE toxin-antitoxin system